MWKALGWAHSMRNKQTWRYNVALFRATQAFTQSSWAGLDPDYLKLYNVKGIEDIWTEPPYIPVGKCRCHIFQEALAHWHCQKSVCFQTWHCKGEPAQALSPGWVHSACQPQLNHLCGGARPRCRPLFLGWDFWFFWLLWDCTSVEWPGTCDASGGKSNHPS